MEEFIKTKTMEFRETQRDAIYSLVKSGKMSIEESAEKYKKIIL